MDYRLKFPGKGLLQQRLFQRNKRHELAPVSGFESFGFFSCSKDGFAPVPFGTKGLRCFFAEPLFVFVFFRFWGS
jgi:hypothetical protein